MAFLTTLGLIAGGVSAAQQFISGASASQRAKRGLEEFEFQDLSVGAFDEFKPSLALEEQQLESIERQRARVADVAAGLGASEAMALLSQTGQQLTQAEQQTQARQEQLMAQADMLRAQDLQQRRQMEEQRSMIELQSLQQEMAAGQQMMASGLSGLSQLAVSAGLARGRMLVDAASGGGEGGGASQVASAAGSAAGAPTGIMAQTSNNASNILQKAIDRGFYSANPQFARPII